MERQRWGEKWRERERRTEVMKKLHNSVKYRASHSLSLSNRAPYVSQWPADCWCHRVTADRQAGRPTKHKNRWMDGWILSHCYEGKDDMSGTLLFLLVSCEELRTSAQCLRIWNVMILMLRGFYAHPKSIVSCQQIQLKAFFTLNPGDD